MAENIVTGLFGLDPYQIRQQQNQQIDDSALQYAKLDPFQKANFSIGRGAGMLAGMGAEAMGYENPQITEAKNRQAALQGLDISSPESILQRAQQVQDPKLKMQLMMLADQKKKDLIAAQATSTKMALELAQAQKALRENPNLAVTEVGVKGKPGYMQRVLFDKTNPTADYQEIGEPYLSAAAAKQTFHVSTGGGESIQPIPYIDPNTGKPTWGTIKEARGQVAAAYDPATKQLLSQATTVGKGRGEEVVNLPKQQGALESVKGAADILDKGIYTGFWGPTQRNVASATPGVDKQKVSNTDEFIAHIGEVVVPRLQEFGGNDSNEELKYLQKISGGDLTMQEGALRNLLKRSQQKIERGIERVQKGMTPDGKPAESPKAMSMDDQARQWLAANPNHPKAAAVRAKLGAK